MPNKPQATLVFSWGNPSRGDDAIGPRIYDMLRARDLAGVDLLTDFQLQIEHTVDLHQRERILFVDASVSAQAPYELCRLYPDKDSSYTTHAMSPSALLAVYWKVNKRSPPASFLLKVRGYEFGLGLPLSENALGNVAKACDFILELVATDDTRSWSARCAPAQGGARSAAARGGEL